MLILNAALAALLALQGANLKAPSITAQTAITALGGPALVRTIKTDLEAIAGTGTVSVTMDNKTSFSARIAIPGFSPKICKRIYDREVELRQLYPDLNFDFYFDGPELAKAIKTDIESISGRDTVDVSIDNRTLFSVRIAIPGFRSEIYSQVYDRELEFYDAFRDLNFDFYLRPKASEPAPGI
jgi:copper chaperone CopZ